MILYLGHVLHPREAPRDLSNSAEILEFLPDGALAVDDEGRIAAIGSATSLRKKFENARIVDFGERWIVPGFVDAHAHFPQLSIIGSFGKDLLEWLESYTYPAEITFSSKDHTREKSTRFFQRLLSHGTTCSALYGTTHAHSAEFLFEAAERAGVRAIIGKVSMDRSAPKELLEEAGRDIEENEALLKKWHGKHDRLYCALTPRFALSCSSKLMQALGDLKEKYPDAYIQTHYAESEAEIAQVKREFPKAKDYLSVYEEHGLIGPKTLLGHCVHPTSSELRKIAEKKPALIHCPTSNTFLGSGLFPFEMLWETGAPIGLGSDVGAGTTLSMTANAVEAYKIQKLRGKSVSPATLFYFATLGGAKALGLDARIGNFEAGKEADFVVSDWTNQPDLIERFEERKHTPEEMIFAMALNASPQNVEEVFVRGESVYRRA